MVPWRLAQSLVLVGCSASGAVGQWQAIPLEPSGYTGSCVATVDGGSQFGNGFDAHSAEHALTWQGSSGSVGVLADSAYVLCAHNGVQGGYHGTRACVWFGTSASRIDLSTPNSEVLGIWGTELVGGANIGGAAHAGMWSSPTGSFVDLAPAGAQDSEAVGTDGVHQAGWIQVAGGAYHAAYWTGTAQSMVDMTPVGALQAQVFGSAPGQQVGYVEYPNGTTHAAVWNGTTASFADLNAPGILRSVLQATCGSAQVGVANPGGFANGAAIWFGTPESFVNLSQFLPSGYSQSVATSVTFYNGQYYVGGYATNSATDLDEAFLWVGVPSPGTGGILVVAGLIAIRRRTRPKSRGPT